MGTGDRAGADVCGAAHVGGILCYTDAAFSDKITGTALVAVFKFLPFHH